MLIPMIRAVLFDLDDTLMDHTSAMHAGLDEWCAELGVAQGQHARFSALERKWFSAYERGEVTHQGQRIERCREFLGQTLDDAASSPPTTATWPHISAIGRHFRMLYLRCAAHWRLG